MPSYGAIALCALVCCCTAYPYLFMVPGDAQSIADYFSQNLHMSPQAFLYAAGRLSSYPFMRYLQAGLATKHGINGSVIVVTIGEALGAWFQFKLFRNTLGEKLDILSEFPILQSFASAIDANPFWWALILRLSFVQEFPYVISIGYPCLAASDAAVTYTGSNIVAGLVELSFVLAATLIPKQQAFIYLELKLAVQLACTVALAYQLWILWRANTAGKQDSGLLGVASPLREAGGVKVKSELVSPERMLRFADAVEKPVAQRTRRSAVASNYIKSEDEDVPSARGTGARRGRAPTRGSASGKSRSTTPRGRKRSSSAGRHASPASKRGGAKATQAEPKTPTRDEHQHHPTFPEIVASRLETTLTDAIYETPRMLRSARRNANK